MPAGDGTQIAVVGTPDLSVALWLGAQPASAETTWGDLGRLHATARRDDLRRGAVEQDRFELQCG